jgi:hypothetical protein
MLSVCDGSGPLLNSISHCWWHNEAGAPLRALQMKSFTKQQGTVTHLHGDGCFKHVTSSGRGILHRSLLPSILVNSLGRYPTGRSIKGYNHGNGGRSRMLLCRRCSVRISAGTPVILTEGSPGKCKDYTSITPRPLPSKSFLIYHPYGIEQSV